MIKTTVNIAKSKKVMIKELAKCRKISASTLLNNLLRVYLENHDYKLKVFKTVEYQPNLDCSEDEWSCFHVSFDEDLYEKCQDFKNLFKISVSFLVSIVFEKFINSENEILVNSDNYTKNYIIYYSNMQNHQSITKFWQLEEEKILEKTQKIQEKQ